MSGMPTSSTTASGTAGRGLRERLLAALGHLHLVAGRASARGAGRRARSDRHRRRGFSSSPFCRRIRRSATRLLRGSYAKELLTKWPHPSATVGFIDLGRRRPAPTGRTHDASLDSAAFARHVRRAHRTVVATSGTTYAAVRIGTKQIRDNAVTSPKIRNGAVRNIDLARNSVVTAKIVASRRHRPADQGRQRRQRRSRQRLRQLGAKIRGGAVGNSDLANDAVTSVEAARRSGRQHRHRRRLRIGAQDRRQLDHGRRHQGRRGRRGQRPRALGRGHAARRHRPDGDPQRAGPRRPARELRRRRRDHAVAQHRRRRPSI